VFASAGRWGNCNEIARDLNNSRDPGLIFSLQFGRTVSRDNTVMLAPHLLASHALAPHLDTTARALDS
jgi:hypothetical protein